MITPSEMGDRARPDSDERGEIDNIYRHLDRQRDGWTGVREGVSTRERPQHLSRYAELLTNRPHCRSA